MLRILHTSDLHLDAPFPGLGAREGQRRADLLKTFERMVNLAIKRDVRLFLVAGNLFDTSHPSAAVLEAVQAGLRRLADRGIQPVLLAGPCDAPVGAKSVYRRADLSGALLLPSAAAEGPLRLQVGGETVYLYAPLASSDLMSSMQRRSTDGLHVGLFHGPWCGNTSAAAHGRARCVDLQTLKSWNLDYVALGSERSFSSIEDAGRLYACYSGTPEGRRFGENGPRCAALVTIEAGQSAVEACPVQTRLLDERTVDLSGCTSNPAAVAKLRALGHPDLLLRAHLAGRVEVPLDLDRIIAECREAFFELELEDRTSLLESDLCRRLAVEETLRGEFVRRLQLQWHAATAERRPLIEAACREGLLRLGCAERGRP